MNALLAQKLAHYITKDHMANQLAVVGTPHEGEDNPIAVVVTEAAAAVERVNKHTITNT